MNGCKIQTRLSGHSGCKIFLMENESKKPFVRKISKDVGYNARLKSQCEKQKHFRHQLIRTPKIFSQGITDDGLFYFDMEYIHGITLAEYIRKIDVNRARLEAFSAHVLPWRFDVGEHHHLQGQFLLHRLPRLVFRLLHFGYRHSFAGCAMHVVLPLRAEFGCECQNSAVDFPRPVDRKNVNV